MFCTKCQNDLEGCTCPDLAEKMRGLSGEGGFFASRWCAGCDKHYAACRCEKPQWVMRSDGKFHQLPDDVKAELADLSKGVEA